MGENISSARLAARFSMLHQTFQIEQYEIIDSRKIQT